MSEHNPVVSYLLSKASERTRNMTHPVSFTPRLMLCLAVVGNLVYNMDELSHKYIIYERNQMPMPVIVVLSECVPFNTSSPDSTSKFLKMLACIVWHTHTNKSHRNIYNHSQTMTQLLSCYQDFILFVLVLLCCVSQMATLHVLLIITILFIFYQYNRIFIAQSKVIISNLVYSK